MNFSKSSRSASIIFVGGGLRTSSGLYVSDLIFPICHMFSNRRGQTAVQPLHDSRTSTYSFVQRSIVKLFLINFVSVSIYMCHPAAQTHTLETCPDLSMNAGTIHAAQVECRSIMKTISYRMNIPRLWEAHLESMSYNPHIDLWA